MALSRKSTGSEQLSLRVTLRDEALFDNYHGTHNQAAVARLRQWLAQPGPGVLALCGAEGAGKSHLLNAACLNAEADGQTALCLGLDEAVHLPPQALEGMEQFDWLCLDDLQALPSTTDWEEALFHLFNRVQDAGHRLLMASTATPSSRDWVLPDLASRLRAVPVIQLLSPSDVDRMAILQARAYHRGLVLSDDVAGFILRRAPRDTESLLSLLARLDEASLRSQRRLTIPFVKEVTGW